MSVPSFSTSCGHNKSHRQHCRANYLTLCPYSHQEQSDLDGIVAALEASPEQLSDKDNRVSDVFHLFSGTEQLAPPSDFAERPFLDTTMYFEGLVDDPRKPVDGLVHNLLSGFRTADWLVKMTIKVFAYLLELRRR